MVVRGLWTMMEMQHRGNCRLSPRFRLAAWVCLVAWVCGCGGGDAPVSPGTGGRPGGAPSPESAPTVIGSRLTSPTRATQPSRSPQEPSPFRFTEIAKGAGVDFVHVSGMTRERHFPTANGSGVAIFDSDGDGRMDIYLASNEFLPHGSRPEGRNRLFRNLGDGKFEDVTERSGLGFQGFCHGIITGDFDNDGDQDVFLATHHQNTLFLNNGDGTFRDVGREAGVAPPAFKGRLVAGESAGEVVTIDAVSGLRWRLNGGEPTDDLTVPVRAGQRIVFRQADPTAARAVDLLIDPAKLMKAGEDSKPGACLREVGSSSRLYVSRPALGAGEEPVVLAEFSVIETLPAPVPFQCAEHRPAWSSGGACLDYDNDGDLDFYVANYGWWTLEQHGSKFCGSNDKKVRQYCSPKEVTTVKHIFYRNDGVVDGIPRFTNVYDEVFVTTSGERKPGPSHGHGFGVVTCDLNGDGLIDIYVANDQNPAFLFLNRGDGTFVDVTEESGAAYDEKGAAQSGMGVDAEDIDGDGKPELFRTNFASEYNTLYQNLGEATFFDQTAAYGLAADAMAWVGWGCALADFDSDGWPDVFVTNGHVDDNYHDLGINNVPYAQPALLFRNVALGTGPGSSRRFRLATRGVGPYFDASHVGRGAAFGDLDDDGDIDIVINQKEGQASILRNDTPMGDNRWIRIKLTGTKSNRDAIGARIEVVLGDRTITRQRKGGYSLESTNDPRVVIGLGPVERIETLIIRWPSGAETILKDVPTNRQLDIVEGETDQASLAR